MNLQEVVPHIIMETPTPLLTRYWVQSISLLTISSRILYMQNHIGIMRDMTQSKYTFVPELLLYLIQHMDGIIRFQLPNLSYHRRLLIIDK